MAEPDATAGTSGAEGAPRWPAAAHRVARISHGRPSMPVPWVLTGVGQAWAWDPIVGLLALTDLGTDLDNLFDWTCLSADGRLLTYQSYTRGRAPKNNQRTTYHLESGKRTAEALTTDPIFLGVDGVRLRVEYTNVVEGAARNSRYVVERSGEKQELALTDLLGYNFTGPTAQFSLAGDELAIGHASQHMRDQWVSITNLSTGAVTRFEGFGLASCATWSPHGARLLVMRRHAYPDIFDRATGELRSLEPNIEAVRTPHGQDHYVSGWLDDTQILINQILGRRLLVWVADVDSGEHHQLLNLPLPTAQRDFYGLRMAPAVAQANPALVGFLGE